MESWVIYIIFVAAIACICCAFGLVLDGKKREEAYREAVKRGSDEQKV